MADLKTKPHKASVKAFIEENTSGTKREDSFHLLEIFKEVTGEEPKMWGPSIIGFGQYHYKYASGRKGDWMLSGFSPRKSKFSVYLMCEHKPLQNLLTQLGKYKTGKSCLYFNKLADIDHEVFKELLRKSIALTKEMYS